MSETALLDQKGTPSIPDEVLQQLAAQHPQQPDQMPEFGVLPENAVLKPESDVAIKPETPFQTRIKKAKAFFSRMFRPLARR